MSTESVQIRNLVDNAVKNVKDSLNEASEKTSQESSQAKEKESGTGKNKENAKEQPSSETDSLTDEELNNAKTLYKALKAGGETAAAVVDALATRNGYQRIETKAELKEAKTEIKNELQEALGEDYPDLYKRLAPAIDKYLERKLEENTKDIRDSLKNDSQAKLEARSEATFNELSTQFYEGKGVPKEIDETMAKLMEKYKPEPNQEIEDYIKDMFHLASSKLGKTPQATKTSSAKTTAVARSRSDAPSNLDRSSGRPLPADTTNARKSSTETKAMTLDQAVKLAIQQVNNEMEKD